MTETAESPANAGSERPNRAASPSRAVQERAAREAGARRALFAAAIASLAAALGVIAASSNPQHDAAGVQPARVVRTAAGQHVIAEVPIPAVDGRSVDTIVRFVAPDPNTTAPHVRTRATP